MGKIGNDKFYGKIYWDKTQEELHEIIHQKLRVLADCVAKHMIMDWRSLADSNVHDPNPTHVGEHDLITMIEFLERYDTEEWGEVFLSKFVQYINEVKNTGGWTQMYRAWEDDPRKDDPRITSRRKENGHLLFENKQDHEQWYANQEKKNLIADALGKRGIGHDPAANSKKYFIAKKRNGVGHA